MIYFYNPHYGPFYGRNVFNALTGRFDHRKYWYLASHLLSKAGKGEARILVNLDQNSFQMLFTYKFRPLNRLVTLAEFAAWLILNRINPLRVRPKFSFRGLGKGDVVFAFAFDNLQRRESLLAGLENSGCAKVIHLTHYMLHTSSVSSHSARLGEVFFAAESDLSKYPFFKKHFPWYSKSAYLLPFIPQERFYSRTPFRDRKMKCLALGTLTILKRSEETRDVMDFFGTDCIHPMRRAIYENRSGITEYVDSGVSLYNTDTAVKDLSARKSAVAKLYLALWNLLKANRRSYFSFSAADRFNQYALAVIPEEINHLPGISWAETMACGCAYIGTDDPMYTDLGLVPGEHYLAYDGTLGGLLKVIRGCQEDPALAERIAENGRRFVAERLSAEKAAGLFFSDLKKLERRLKEGASYQELSFISSFARSEK
ncbi:MAG: glycosyltransferase [Elusimicrobiales bacterium]|nr:glycosyltransferase [Elusimicrobiales bacterium]